MLQISLHICQLMMNRIFCSKGFSFGKCMSCEGPSLNLLLFFGSLRFPSTWRHLRTFNLCMVAFRWYRGPSGPQSLVDPSIVLADHGVFSATHLLSHRTFHPLLEKSMFPTCSRSMSSFRYSWWQCWVCDLAVFAELPLVALTMQGLRLMYKM